MVWRRQAATSAFAAGSPCRVAHPQVLSDKIFLWKKQHDVSS
jgi:hypothetical protein